jgi:hypothetical protein
MIKRRDKEDNAYAHLLRRALADIQALSGNRWTDFNAHDPGVTILENALYALTEIQYQLQFPFETYLFRTKYMQSGLFPAEKIAAPSLVTPTDYEQLICYNIKEVKDCCVSISDKGRYIIRVKTVADKTAVRHRIIELYHANRNLCETLEEIVFEDQITRNDDANAASDDAPQFVPPAKNATLKQSLPNKYHSFQRNFPDTYGINEKGAPASCTPVRKAQILQLKAYLLIFDYLMANALHQTGNIADLLQLSDKLPPYYSPNFSIDDMDKLLDHERFKDNKLYNTDFWCKQKSRLLDVLDMLYGEDTKSLVADEADLHTATKKRVFLIRHFLRWNTHRFRSYNLLKYDANNIPEIAHLINAVLGNRAITYTYWIEHILMGDYPGERNRLTVVQYAYMQQNIDKTALESFIRKRLPAHLDVRFLYLDINRMSKFWKMYLFWREEISLREIDRRYYHSTRLYNFLISR